MAAEGSRRLPHASETRGFMVVLLRFGRSLSEGLKSRQRASGFVSSTIKGERSSSERATRRTLALGSNDFRRRPENSLAMINNS